MKGFYCFAMFAFCYILLMLLFQASAQQQFIPGSSIKPSSSGPSTSSGSSNSGSNSSDGSALSRLQNLLPTSLSFDSLGITDPNTRQTLTNVYGTLLGQPDCIKKSICISGNYLHELPGRDIFFTLLGRYVPPEWGLLYDIFRVSVMYGQNCQVYFCTVEDSKLPSPTANQQQYQNEQGAQQQPQTQGGFASNFDNNDNQIHKSFDSPSNSNKVHSQ